MDIQLVISSDFAQDRVDFDAVQYNVKDFD